MSLRAVLFDMGGVLLDLADSNGVPGGQLDFRGRQELLGRVGAGRRVSLDELEDLVFEPWRREYRKRYVSGREASWKPHLSRLRRRAGSRAHDLELLAAWFGPFGERCEAIAGALETVRSMTERGLKLGLVSNVPLPGALYRRILKRHQMDAYFDIFRFSYESGHRKPSPYMLRSALTELEVPPDEALMVGDRRSSDVAAGRAAGVGTVWLESAHSEGPRPDWQIRSIDELPAVIDSSS